MKQFCTLLLLLTFSLSANSQSQTWTSKSYKSLKLSFPANWTQLDYVNALGLGSYGLRYPDPLDPAFKEGSVELRVTEAPNDSVLKDAHTLTKEDLENDFDFLWDSELQKVENRKIANVNAKYVESSGIYDDTVLTYIFIYNGQLIIATASYSDSKKEEFLPDLEKVFRNIELI